jgi:hypothetical protein
VRFPCVHAAATTPVQQLGVICALAPSHISLPRYPCRVGLHVGCFETCSAFTHVAACTRARSPSCDRYPEASDISSPPCLLRLLPAGAFAGSGLHPLDSGRLPRRTGPATILICSSRPDANPSCARQRGPYPGSETTDSALTREIPRKIFPNNKNLGPFLTSDLRSSKAHRLPALC